jgi:hypothetical protein
MKSISFGLVLVALILSVSLFAAFSCGGDDDDDDDDDAPSSPWDQEIIDQIGDVGLFNSLVLDKNGDAHVSYYDATNQVAKYATNKSGLWENEDLATLNPVEGPNAIAIGDDGTLYVVYCAAGLVTVYGTAGDWTSPQNLDPEADCTKDLDVTVDGQGQVSIGYSTQAGGFRWFTYGGDSSISDTIEDSKVGTGSITVNSAGLLHASFDQGGKLMYATPAGGGGWQAEVVDDGGNLGQFSSVAYDGEFVHISYYDKGNGVLKYATNTSGVWESSVVDDSDDVGMHTSLVLAEGGSAHIAYYGNPAVRYATNFGGVWESLMIDAKVGDGQTDTSIAIDADGYLHMTYYDINSQMLKYAVSKQPLESISAE